MDLGRIVEMLIVTKLVERFGNAKIVIENVGCRVVKLPSRIRIESPYTIINASCSYSDIKTPVTSYVNGASRVFYTGESINITGTIGVNVYVESAQ